ncbi:uncharacterized protein LOC135401718 [Ornithodoros turicata]|uniref:uncharacterized protein LOC135401718 n=1 Tax=Ornithodoros turicata TaxID=34597 RepID=UPI0031399219
MSAGKVLALIVVVVSFAVVAVAVSWCCWCIRSRFSDKNIQPVKSAATVADTLDSSRAKSSAGSLPVPASCPSDTAPAAIPSQTSVTAKRKLSIRLPDSSPVVCKDAKDTKKTLTEAISQISLEPLVAENLYQRKSSKLDLFSRENSLLSTDGDTLPLSLPLSTKTKMPTATATKQRTLEEGLTMAKLSERKQSKYDLFSRENSLMDSELSQGADDQAVNQARLEEELLADLRREGQTVKAPRKLSIGKKELLKQLGEHSAMVANTAGSPKPIASPVTVAGADQSPVVAASVEKHSSTPPSTKSAKSKASKTSKKSHKHKKKHAKSPDGAEAENPQESATKVESSSPASSDAVKGEAIQELVTNALSTSPASSDAVKGEAIKELATNALSASPASSDAVKGEAVKELATKALSASPASSDAVKVEAVKELATKALSASPAIRTKSSDATHEEAVKELSVKTRCVISTATSIETPPKTMTDKADAEVSPRSRDKTELLLPDKKSAEKDLAASAPLLISPSTSQGSLPK